MSSNKIKFTKPKLSSIEPPESGRTDYYDTEAKGLQLRVTAGGTKTFAVRKRIDTKMVRTTLGRFPDMAIDQARRQAAQKVAEMLDGVNPNDAKRVARARGVTLKECLDDYLSTRADLAESTIKGYQQSMGKHLEAWYTKPLKEISRDMVEQRHKRISEKHPVAANNVMRTLRALFNFANGKYEGAEGEVLFADNPVSRLSHNRQWTPEKRRQTIIKSGELAGWFMGVDTLRDDAHGDTNEPAYVVADYLEFILLTGLRRDDALKLRWDQVELDAAIMNPVIHKKKQEVISLPLSDYVMGILKRRYANRVNEYVFTGRYGKERMDDPKKQIAKVVERTGIKFSSHDLRRTFITVAGSLELSGYTVKRLCTHTISNDVTGGYIIFDAERLREPSQRIETMILKQAGKLPVTPVTRLVCQSKSREKLL